MRETTFAAFASRQTHAALVQVSARLRQASKHPGDPEAIHDLRVSIRRFTQCLRTFEGLFDPIAAGRVRKRLRKLLKLCGAVRNCDIAMELLPMAGLPENDPAYAHLRQRRNDTEEALVRHLRKKRWMEFAKRNRLRLSPQPSPAHGWDLRDSIGENAHAVLPRLFADFFAAGSTAAASNEDYETMHQFRLRAKRFRYTLELFQDIYGAGLKRRLAVIRMLQDKLGAINDCLTTVELIDNNPAAVLLVRRHLVGREQAFRDFWQTTFTAETGGLWGRWLGRSVSQAQAVSS